jgi:hypothetical protein
MTVVVDPQKLIQKLARPKKLERKDPKSKLIGKLIDYAENVDTPSATGTKRVNFPIEPEKYKNLELLCELLGFENVGSLVRAISDLFLLGLGDVEKLVKRAK